MNNKKLIQMIVICVVAVWIFCITFLVGVIRIRKQNEDATSLSPLFTSDYYTESQTNQPTDFSVTQEAPSTSENEQTTASSFETSVSTAQPSQQPTSAQPAIPSSKSDIIQTYVQAVNKLKSETDFTLTKTEILSVSISEMSPDSAKSMVNKMIANNSSTEPIVYHFAGGSDASSGMSPTNVIAPLGTSASLSESVVTSAKATPNSDGSFTLKLSLGQEVQTLDSSAPNYSTSMQVIKLETLGLPSSAKIDSLTITYDNSTIEALIGSDGRILSMKQLLNVSHAEASGSMVFPISAKLSGNFTATYEINY